MIAIKNENENVKMGIFVQLLVLIYQKRNTGLTSSWLAISLQCSNRVLRISRQLLVMPTSHNVAAVCLHTSEEALRSNRKAHYQVELDAYM